MDQEYSSQEIRLANELADALKDWDSINLHLKYVRRYKEEFLRRVLAKVMSIDERHIRKSRAALYTYLISQGRSHGNFRD